MTNEYLCTDSLCESPIQKGMASHFKRQDELLLVFILWLGMCCASFSNARVDLEIESDRNTYIHGDPITISVLLTITGETATRAGMPEGDAKTKSGLHVQLRHVESDSQCPRTDAYWPAHGGTRLDPGETMTRQFNLNRLFRIRPGRYKCRASYAVIVGVIPHNENGELDPAKKFYEVLTEAKAPEISFTVKPDDGKEAAKLLNMLRSTEEKAARAAELLNDAPIRVVRDCAEEVWSQIQKRDGQAKEKLLLFFVRNERVFRDIVTGKTLVEQLRWISKCENDTLRLLAAQTFRTWRGALRLDALYKFQGACIHDWFRREENPKCRVALMKIGLPKDALLAVARNDPEAQVRLAALKLFARRDIYGFLEISDSFAEAEDKVVVDGKETTLGEAVRVYAELYRQMLEGDGMPLERPE